MIPTRQQIIRKPSRGAIFITLHNNTSAKLDCERGASTLRFCSRLAPLSPVWRTAREVQECHSRVGMTSTTGAGVTPPTQRHEQFCPRIHLEKWLGQPASLYSYRGCCRRVRRASHQRATKSGAGPPSPVIGELVRLPQTLLW